MRVVLGGYFSYSDPSLYLIGERFDEDQKTNTMVAHA